VNSESSSSSPAVELRGVTFGYGSTVVLDQVDLRVQRLDALCIVGPNGGGKTTLLKIILGLLRPDRGEVRLLGGEPARTRRRVGYVSQQIVCDMQYPVSVLDVARMGALRPIGPGFGRRKRREQALAALDEMGVADLHGRQFAEISGGQRQRVLIARALMCDPEILLLDEPTANVDVQVEARLFDALRDLNKRVTILMVSHNARLVSNLVHHVVCVDRQVAVHPTEDVSDALVSGVYSGLFRMVRHDQTCPTEPHGHE
jgi:zinc transport system ATP-binding protein